MLLHGEHKIMFYIFLIVLCIEFMWVSSSLSDQNEVVKIAVWSVEHFSYHDYCDNYAQGWTPNPLPAVNHSNLSVLDHFFRGANLVCTGNLVMNAIKKLNGLRWAQKRQLVFRCKDLLVLLSSQVWWEWWPSEGRILWSCGDSVFGYAAKADIVCRWRCFCTYCLPSWFMHNVRCRRWRDLIYTDLNTMG